MTFDTINISILLLTGYIVTLATLAIWTHIKQDHHGYVIGERKLGLFSTICTMLAGQFNGGGVFIVFTFGLMLGYGQLWFTLGFLLGYILLSFFAKTVHDEGKEFSDVNVPDILNRRIGKHTQHFGSFIIIGKACLFGTAQLLIAGTVTAALFDIPNAYGIWLAATVIGGYVYLGGYLTVVRTDILQWAILFTIALCAAFLFPKPDLIEVTNDIIRTETLTRWGGVLFTFMLIISNADVWQRMMSAKTGQTGKLALRSSGALFIIFIFSMVIILKSWNLDAGIDFFELIKNQTLPPLTSAILGVFTLVAVMSTIDTQVQLFSSALSKNVFQINLENQKERFVQVSRIATVLLLGGIAILASTLGSTMEFILKAFSFAYILAPVMIASMIWGKQGTRFKDTACIVALTCGFCVYIFMFFNGYFSSMLNNVIPAGVTMTICMVAILFEKIMAKSQINLHKK